MATIIDDPENKAWLQVVDQAVTMRPDGGRILRQIVKGKTSAIATLVNNLYSGQTYANVQTAMTQALVSIEGGIGVNWSPPIGYTWYLSQFEVKQIEAGQLSHITLTYELKEIEVTPGGGRTTVKEDSWQLQWQTYSVTPYRYCNEKAHVDYLVNSDGEADPGTTESSKCTVRRHIDMALTQNAQNSDNNQYQWTMMNVTRQLTESEVAIAKKVAAGVNPTFHYPIVIHRRVVETTLSSMPSELAPDVEGIDVIASLPSAPALSRALAFWNTNGYQWIYCGQNVQSTKSEAKVQLGPDTTTYLFTTEDVFEGALSADTNFYGPFNTPPPTNPAGRWKFGEGPQLPPEGT